VESRRLGSTRGTFNFDSFCEISAAGRSLYINDTIKNIHILKLVYTLLSFVYHTHIGAKFVNFPCASKVPCGSAEEKDNQLAGVIALSGIMFDELRTK
jgi:hypothetical protein